MMKLLQRTSLASALRGVPGINGSFRLTEHESAGGHAFGLISDGLFHTIILQFWNDPRLPMAADADHWQRMWGNAVQIDRGNTDLVSLTAIWDIAAATRESFQRWSAGQSVNPADTSTLAYAALTFRGRASGRAVAEQIAVDLAVRFPALLDSLHLARLPARPLTSDEIVTRVAQVYSPGESISDSVTWPRAIASETDEARHFLAHAGGYRSTSWMICPRAVEDHSLIVERAMDSDLSATLPNRRITVSYRRVRSDSHGYDPGLLHRHITVLTVCTPAEDAPSLATLIGEGPRELPVSARVGIRRAYDRQGELCALSAGLGVVLPEHARVDSRPVYRTALTVDEKV